MDLQYAEDVAGIFIRGAIATLEGAHVFNLAGEVIRMEDLITLLDRIRPGAAELVTCAGPTVGVAYRMDDSAIRSKLPDLPRTPLEVGAARTIEIFERLRAVK